MAVANSFRVSAPNNRMAEEFHEDDALEESRDWRHLRRLIKYIRPYRAPLAGALALSIFSSLAMVAGPWLIGKTIDWYIVPVSGGPPDWGGMLRMAAIFVGLGALIFVSEFGDWMLVSRAGQEAMRDLRMDIFSRIQSLSLPYFDRNPVGRLITRLTNDVATLNELLSSGIVDIIKQSITVLGILILLMCVNFKLFLAAGVVLPILFAAAWNFRKQIRGNYRETRRRLARLNAFLQENVTGMRTVQAYTRQSRQFTRFARLNNSYREAMLATIFHYALFFPIVEFCALAAATIAVWKGGGQVLRSSLTLGELALFIQALDRIFLPVRELAERYNLVQAGMAASERIFDLLDQKPEVPAPENPVELKPFAHSIEFRDVWMAYRDEQWVLRGLNLKIEKGQTVAVVGPTGSGKSTLINLLCRFYEFQKGDILIDGHSIRSIAPESWRRQAALVLQDVFLFHGSVLSNIRLGNESITEDQAREAAQRVQADPFIQRMPSLYQSHVMERGATLSVGQKQLLAFARALAFDPRLLILDEATAHIDTDTERLIQEALEELMRGRTSLVIAHRLSTIQRADKIAVLHHGRIAEEGAHQELLARNGLYKRLYELQYAQNA